MLPKLLWSTDYYDGPIRGVAELNGEKLYFNTKDDGGWEIYKPTAEEIEAIEKEISGKGPEVDDIYWDDCEDGSRIYHKCADRVYNLYTFPISVYESMLARHQMFEKMVKGNESTKETIKRYYADFKSRGDPDMSVMTFLKTCTGFAY